MTLWFLNPISRVFVQKVAHHHSSSLAWGAKLTDASLHLSMQMRPQRKTPHQIWKGSGQLQIAHLHVYQNGVKAYRTNGERAPANLHGTDKAIFLRSLVWGQKFLTCTRVWAFHLKVMKKKLPCGTLPSATGVFVFSERTASQNKTKSWGFLLLPWEGEV